MTTETWQEREMACENLLARLLHQALEKETQDDVLLFDIGISLFAHLKQRRRNAPRHNMGQIPPFFFEVVLTEIHKFARSQAEEDSLLADFLEQTTGEISIGFYHNRRREEGAIPS